MVMKLKNIADAFEATSDSFDQYLNVKTGEIISLPGIAYMGTTEEFEKDIEKVDSSNDYVRLPDQRGLREYDIMELFIDSINLDSIKSRLLNSIHRSHPFRNFKNEAMRLDIINDYYDFRYKEFEKKAKRWCKDNNIKISS